MNNDIVDLLRQGSSGCTCSAWNYHECGCVEAHWSEMYIDAAADEIEKLRSLIKEIIPYMLNDMEQGLTLGQPPFDVDHCKDKPFPCPDCQWFEDASIWKQRLNSGEFKDYI